MSKSKEIIALEKKLAQAKAREKNTSKTYLLWVKEGDDISEIEVQEKNLSEIDKAELIGSTVEISENLKYIVGLNEGFDSQRMGYWIKVMYLLDKPFQKFLSTLFGLNEKIIPAIPNAEVISDVFSNNEWLGEETAGIIENLSVLAKSESKK